MSAAFDPGPLSVLCQQKKTEIGGFYVIGPDRMGAATAYVSGRYNAALYAAAPELYEALESAPEPVKFEQSREGLLEFVRAYKEWVPKVYPALAKALGQ